MRAASLGNGRGNAAGPEVLHVLWQGTGGGAERHVLDLSRGLQGRGVSNAVLYLSSDGGTGVLLDRAGVSHCNACLAGGSDPRGPLRVARIVRGLRPHLIHDHVSTPWLRALLPRSRGTRIVATEHGHLLRSSCTREGLRLWIERCGARRTDLYLAPSNAIAAAVREHYRFPPSRIRVIPHGIDRPSGLIPPPARAEIRRDLGIPDGSVVLLFVGRLDETKGALDLATAFSEIASKDGRIVLLVAGTGELRERLTARFAMANLRGRARLLGFRGDVERLLSAADLFVLPARQEAFGLVLLEAMAAGLPVVATRTGGIPEIVEDERTGILVEPENPASFAAAVLRLAEDGRRRQSLGRAGRMRWEQNFTLDRSVERTMEAYRWALGRRE